VTEKDPYKDFLDKAHALVEAINEDEGAIHPVVRTILGAAADDKELAAKAAEGIVDMLKSLTGTKKLVREHIEGLMLAIALCMKQGDMFEGLAKLGIPREGHEAMKSFACATSEMVTQLELVREDRTEDDWTPPVLDKKEEVVDSAGTGNYL
jgi:hypothetical protein